MYQEYLTTLGKRFAADLSTIEAVHNFDYGTEFEIAFCTALRLALPQSYGICRGFAVDRHGTVAGDDILIFEQLRYPTLGLRDANAYLRKDKILIEAVYAYIEAKYTLHLTGDGPQSITRAAQQVARVKKLCSGRDPVPFSAIAPGINLTGNAGITPPANWPAIRNPMFGAIIARHVAVAPGDKHLQSAEGIHQAICENVTLSREENAPDLLCPSDEPAPYRKCDKTKHGS
jgi:hypothetical protein